MRYSGTAAPPAWKSKPRARWPIRWKCTSRWARPWPRSPPRRNTRRCSSPPTATAAWTWTAWPRPSPTFERTLISQDSAFDRFLKGERAALNDQALWGLHLFRTKARCINCHNSPLLSDNQFHNTGLNYIGRDKEDLGRGGVTGLRADLGKFRTPTLRDLLYTGDYMHTGDMPLDEEGAGVIEFYNNGGNLVEAVGVEKYTLPKPSPLLKPLGLSAAEKQALHAFLQALSGPPRGCSRPARPSSSGAEKHS
ncbi:hypothetical protein JOS77_12375 [Chromobacterium haemolyticum]|nr:hypothetical protein JOS77_12375 [Chromobacterium haemolyticum]